MGFRLEYAAYRKDSRPCSRIFYLAKYSEEYKRGRYYALHMSEHFGGPADQAQNMHEGQEVTAPFAYTDEGLQFEAAALIDDEVAFREQYRCFLIGYKQEEQNGLDPYGLAGTFTICSSPCMAASYFASDGERKAEDGVSVLSAFQDWILRCFGRDDDKFSVMVCIGIVHFGLPRMMGGNGDRENADEDSIGLALQERLQ